MANYLKSDYQLNYTRYKHYYRQIWKFYQKPVVKVSSALLLTLFTIIFFAIFAIKPTLVTVAELLKTINDQEEVLTKLKQKAAALASAQEEYSLNRLGIERLNQAVPEDKYIQELIMHLEAVAATHNLVIDSMSFEDFDYGKTATLPDTVTLPFTLATSADYNTLKAFLTELVRLPRFLSVQSINFNQQDEDSNSSSAAPLKLSISLQAHYMPVTDKE